MRIGIRCTAGCFGRQGAGLELVEEEMVAAPADFVSWVGQRSGDERVSWISMDPEKMTAQEAWQSSRQRWREC